jgi:hypothetical protein
MEIAGFRIWHTAIEWRIFVFLRALKNIPKRVTMP